MKKTIIALAAASSVALSHGVAVAEEGKQAPITVQAETKTTGSVDKGDKDAKGSSDRDLGREIFGWQDGTQQAYKNGVPVFDAEGNPVPEEKTTFGKKFKDIAGAVAAVVALLGSISALIANIEKIAKQFAK